jgi:hypothetical protein
MQSAGRMRGSDKLSERKQVIFREAQNCAYIVVQIILKNNQCNVTENLPSFILCNQMRFNVYIF